MEMPEEGNYTLVIETLEPKQANSAESRAKGFNVEIKFSVDDDTVDPRLRVYHNVWVHYDNTFFAKEFFEKLMGQELEGIDLNNPTQYVGLKIGAPLVTERYTRKDKTEGVKMVVPSTQSFYGV
jgi:uncharacterized GH25 family protein